MPTMAMMSKTNTVPHPIILTSFIPLSTIPPNSPPWSSVSMSRRDSQNPGTGVMRASGLLFGPAKRQTAAASLKK